MIAIVGPGAVGLGLGSCLLAAGERVRFVTRTQDAARALATHGLQRGGLFGERHFPADAFDLGVGVESLRDQRLDWILVCTKTPASAALADELGRIWNDLQGARRIVLFHNGWGSAAHFAAQLQPKLLYNATVITGFQRRASHAVDITVHADAVRIGSLYGADLAALGGLCDAIARGDLPCEVSPAIEKDLWAKMLYNCALNPLGALIGVSYGALGERRETRSILEAVVAEIFALLRRTGHRTHWGSAREYLEVFWRDLLPPTAAHESSMLQDLRAGRRSEVDELTGAVAALAQEHGVRAPVCAALTRLVHAREDRIARLD